MPSLTPSNRHYLIKYEMLNTITHALGALAAIIGATLLLVKAWQHHLSSLTLTALSIYAISMIGFLLASTLFHALVFTKAGKLFQFLIIPVFTSLF
ncbi:hemolysin [Weissella viridescens]|uniref:Hemolysin n=1 Tax=Weissella viridescens TaxID=1629 RepID=A0A380NY37_WEIVI|nr:hemolysin [Weissella viridescens]